MKKILIILILICYAYDSSCQLVDDFSDADYTNNPTWIPDDPNNWTVANGQLRSNSSLASTSFYISTPSAWAINAQWEIYLQLQFNTSGANYVDIYLTSELENLLDPANHGYFVRIGGTADEIGLYKMTAGAAIQLINGEDGITNRSNNPIRIKVIRNENSDWILQRDANGGTTFVTEGEASDNSYSAGSFFGIRIQQSTSSFFNKHFFDEIYVGDIRTEQDPPLLDAIEVISDKQLLLHFNEQLEVNSAETPSHYRLSNTNQPVKAELQAEGTTVRLTFEQAFTNGLTYTIDVTDVQDLAGNPIEPVSMPFVYFKAYPVQEKDIIITEIFADPTPQVGLPEAEFIELYNRSEHPIDVNGWKFSDGNSTATLPSRIILPGQHWVLCSTANAVLFSSAIHVIGVSNFPTLNNSGEAITLKTGTGVVMDSVLYSLAWYRDEDKQEGGWSLELIDPNNPCGEEANWTAAENDLGGTPGKMNSVNANKPDFTGPRLLSLSVTAPNELNLKFNEKLEKNPTGLAFEFTPEINVTAWSYSSTLREITLTLLQNLAPQTVYAVRVSNLHDCNGNPVQEDFNHLTFALPEEAEAGDVLINEVLFNPRPGGTDFVEIINVSSKYISLKNWALANFEAETINNPRIISTEDILLHPGQLLALAYDVSVIKNHYPNAERGNLFPASIPSMNDDEGSIAILSSENAMLDSFVYSDAFHSPLLKDKEGVSLERVSVIAPSNNPDNWKSASSSAGFATPGYLNSNARMESQPGENSVSVNPEIFSPAVPGQDFALINYQFDQNALAANIRIVDQQGRVIKEIANNETLGQEGFFRWDGDRNDGSKANMGYYFVWFETFSLDGMVKTYRKRVVVGR